MLMTPPAAPKETAPVTANSSVLVLLRSNVRPAEALDPPIDRFPFRVRVLKVVVSAEAAELPPNRRLDPPLSVRLAPPALPMEMPPVEGVAASVAPLATVTAVLLRTSPVAPSASVPALTLVGPV